MNNPNALDFVNQNVRPMAERLRALKAQLDADLQRWAAISGQFATGADSVEDGREAEGVSRLLCSDVTNFMSILTTLQTAFNQAGRAATIDKPCVRALTAS